MDKFSLIVPVYNTKKEYLKECIDSVLKQDYQNFEIIVVDDGSKEDIANYCDELCVLDNRIIVYHQANQGVSMARNFGIDKATGKWICFLDADDWLEENALTILSSNIENSDCVIFKMFYDNKVVTSGVNETLVFEDNTELLNSFLLCGTSRVSCPEAMGGKLYSARFLKDNNIYFEKGMKRGEDLIFNLDAYSKAEKIKYISTPLYHYRKNEESEMNICDDSIIEKCEIVINKIKERFIKLGKKDIETQMYFFIINYINLYYCHGYFFNKKNRMSVKEKNQKLKDIVIREPYKTAIQNVNIRQLGLRKVMLVLLVRLKLYNMIRFLY